MSGTRFKQMPKLNMSIQDVPPALREYLDLLSTEVEKGFLETDRVVTEETERIGDYERIEPECTVMTPSPREKLPTGSKSPCQARLSWRQKDNPAQRSPNALA